MTFLQPKNIDDSRGDKKKSDLARAAKSSSSFFANWARSSAIWACSSAIWSWISVKSPSSLRRFFSSSWRPFSSLRSRSDGCLRWKSQTWEAKGFKSGKMTRNISNYRACVLFVPSKSVIMASCLVFSFWRLFDFSSSSARLVVNSEILSSSNFFSCVHSKGMALTFLKSHHKTKKKKSK